MGVGVIRAATNERGVFRYEGRMVDAPLLRHAEQILSSVGRLGPAGALDRRSDSATRTGCACSCVTVQTDVSEGHRSND